MEEEKVSFRESRIYPIIFMVMITILFVGILAIIYQLTQARIQEYNKIKLESTVLSLFGLPIDKVHENFQQYIVIQKLKIDNDTLTYYEAKKDTLLGFAFSIKGKGLWGTIEAMISVDPTKTHILHLEITSQTETPGLGGRIGEFGFRSQFNNKTILNENKIQKFKLTQENNTNPAPNEIRQITGATLSTNYVIALIQDNMKKILSAMDGKNYE